MRPTAAPAPTVLLIGDDPTARSIALSMLRHLGVEADAAPSGAAGLARAAERPYDVALVAVPLVGLDPAAAVRGLRAAGTARVVALAAHLCGRAEACGFDAAFQTPLSVALLAEALAPPVAAMAGADDTAPAARGHADAAFVARPRPARLAGSAALLAAVRAHVTALLGEEDEAFVQELTASFADSARRAAADAAAARAADDVEGIARAAHALKGSASNVGLATLTAAWSEIETHARGGAVPDAPLAEAIAETERTVAHLAQAAGQGGA